jgi:beta-lactam-binding protein with PASTA domain
MVLMAIVAAQDDEEGGRAVPNVVGLKQARAVDVLEAAGYRADPSRTASEAAPAFVVDQNPDAGIELPRDQTVEIIVSSGLRS